MLVASVMMCMNFMPMEYDLHPNEFYACSMTFILSAVRSSYHGKTCELHTAIILQTALLGQNIAHNGHIHIERVLATNANLTYVLFQRSILLEKEKLGYVMGGEETKERPL